MSLRQGVSTFLVVFMKVVCVPPLPWASNCYKLILITGCCIINNNFQLNSQFIVILLIFVENGDIIALLDSHEIEISDL